MDVEINFRQTFCPLSFDSFKGFWNYLDRFQKEHGFIYSFKSFDAIRDDTELARRLVYNRIHFVCSYHDEELNGKIDNQLHICSSYIILQRSRNKLQIESYCMQHNNLISSNDVINENDGNEKLESTGYDLSCEFAKHFPFSEFTSLEELSNRLRQFEVATGALYVKLNSRRFPEGHPMRDLLVYSNIKYVCYHYGTCVSCATKRVNQRTSKLGCSSQIYLNYSDGRLRITSCDMRHNHPVTPESAKMYPRNRRLEEHEQKLVDELLRLPYDNGLVVEIIKKQFGKHCTKADVKNMRSRLRRKSKFIQVDTRDDDYKSDLESILREIREVAQTSSEDLLVQNMVVLKNALSAWKQGRVVAIAEGTPFSVPTSSSYRNAFNDGPDDLMVDYNSPYLVSNDTQ